MRLAEHSFIFFPSLPPIPTRYVRLRLFVSPPHGMSAARRTNLSREDVERYSRTDRSWPQLSIYFETWLTSHRGFRTANTSRRQCRPRLCELQDPYYFLPAIPELTRTIHTVCRFPSGRRRRSRRGSRAHRHPVFLRLRQLHWGLLMLSIRAVRYSVRASLGAFGNRCLTYSSLTERLIYPVSSRINRRKEDLSAVLLALFYTISGSIRLRTISRRQPAASHLRSGRYWKTSFDTRHYRPMASHPTRDADGDTIAHYQDTAGDGLHRRRVADSSRTSRVMLSRSIAESEVRLLLPD